MLGSQIISRRQRVRRSEDGSGQRASRIDGQTDSLHTYVDRFLIKSLWYRCVACGWRREKPEGNELEMSKVGLLITALMQ